MDLVTLQRKISSLESSLDSLERWLFAMTALVVIGLMLEYWHELPEAYCEMRRAGRWLWRPACIIVGAVLITGGVAGELLVQHFASSGETELRKANDQVFAELSSKSSAAIERASEADERASANGKEAAALRLKSAEIQESVASRRLPETTRRSMSSHLEKYAGQTVRTQFNAGDRESGVFASGLAMALGGAKWDVFTPGASVWVGAGGERGPLVLPVGVVIASSPDKKSRDAAAALGHELCLFGFDSNRDPREYPPAAPAVYIIVEARPEGPQGEAKLRKMKPDACK
jgi:hypothetical protein